MSDLKDRQTARLSLSANVVVEAGAGTGKTTLLTDRLLFLLLGGRDGKPVPVSRVVALTFTDKAAGEIKLRLTERLVELAAALSGAGEASPRARSLIAELEAHFPKTRGRALEAARDALESLDRAQIGTIHSFASHLLRLHPVEAGVDPAFRVDEGEHFEELFAAEWARWLDAELGERAPRERDWLEVLRLCPLEDIEALARRLAAESLDLSAVGKAQPSTADDLESLAAAAARLADGKPKPAGGSKILESLKRVSARLRELAAAARSPEPLLPATLAAEELKESSWPKAWPDEGRDVYERACAVARAAAPGGEALLRRACSLVLPFARSFRAAYARAGFVSFDGLLRRARDLVRDHPHVRESLKAGIEALLIDEFQDTDPLQGELLLFLAERRGDSARRWRDVRLAPGRLFIVGDPKQSIYRFRGADIAAYESFVAASMRSGDALSCALTTNFRSDPRLIGAVNGAFAALMRRESGLQPDYAALTPGAGARGGAGSCVSLAVLAEEADAGSSHRAEADWICRWLAEHAGPGRGYRLRDVAILMRSAAGLAPLLDALKAAAIPYAVDIERYFYGAQEVVDLMNLLRALDEPGDRLALAGLLRSPLGGLEDVALYRLASGGGLDYEKGRASGLSGEPARRVERLYSALRDLRALVGREPVAAVVGEAFRRLPLLELSAGAYHGQQTVSNLQKFLRLSWAASDERGATLKEFLGRLRAAAQDPKAEGESPLADEHLEAVRIMTVHKSKGLEFPVVILANASTGRGGAGRPQETLVDWSSGRVGLRLPGGAADATMAWLRALEAERSERELVRLLYVALTRAKERLIIVGRRKGESAALSSRLAEAGLWPREGDAASVPVDWIAPADPPAPRRPAVRATAPDLAALGKAWTRRLALRDDALAKPWTTSPSALVGEPEKAGEAPEAVRPAASAALVGELCHRALERWDFRPASAKAEVEAAASALARLRPEADWDQARKEAEDILSGFASSAAAARLRGAELVGREVPLVYARDGAVVRGSIDLLCRLDGRLTVIDYKTDRVAKKDAARRRAHYAAQGRAYCEAVERALGAKGVAFEIVFLRTPEL